MAAAINIGANLTVNPQSLNTATKEIRQALGRITGNASEFQKSLDASTARVFAFGATTLVIQGINQAFKALIGTTIEVEKRMTEIKTIFGGTSQEFNAFREDIFQVAKDTGQAFSTVADAAAEFARQGLSAEETAKRLEAALVLTNVSGLDSVKSVNTLTAAINGFQSAALTAEQVTNKLVAVDTRFAVSAKDLADGLSRAGSTAEDAGVSFDELLGIITAVQQRTQRGGAVIGNALKTIFTRIGRQGVIEDLQALGVAIDESQSGVQKLKALGEAFEAASGDTTKQNQIKEIAAGGFQINIISAALKDLNSQQSVFADATKASTNAAQEGYEKNAEIVKTLAGQINALVVGLTNMAEKVGQITFAPILETLVGIAS
jgi:TP901 family phage tail tape measure protein